MLQEPSTSYRWTRLTSRSIGELQAESQPRPFKLGKRGRLPEEGAQASGSGGGGEVDTLRNVGKTSLGVGEKKNVEDSAGVRKAASLRRNRRGGWKD